MLPKNLQLFVFSIFRLLVYLMKVILETRRAHYVIITITGSIALLVDF